MRPLAVLAVIAVASPGLAGCAELLPNRGGPCEWLILQAYPQVDNASQLAVHVWARNCSDEPRTIEGSPCVPNLGTYPWIDFEGERYLLGLGAATRLEDIPPLCEGFLPATPVEPREVAPRQTTGIHSSWNGEIRVGANETMPAPPGEYVIRVEVFDRLDVATVTLREDGTFEGGKR